jgi:hypothetical protein
MRAVRRTAFGALVSLAACGGGDADPDPCADLAGTCLAIRVTSEIVAEIDQLQLDILYGEDHDTISAEAGRVVALPVATAIVLDDAAVTLEVGVVAAGKLGGVVLGTGAASTTVEPAARAAVIIDLAAVAVCQDGAFYCGGDQLAGDPDTLYVCDAGSVPQARGRCRHGCEVNPSADDVCDGGPETCTEGGFYCGGNEVDGDPRTRYTCSGGAGTDPVECADGCAVMPAGTDDECR